MIYLNPMPLIGFYVMRWLIAKTGLSVGPLMTIFGIVLVAVVAAISAVVGPKG